MPRHSSHYTTYNHSDAALAGLRYNGSDRDDPRVTLTDLRIRDPISPRTIPPERFHNAVERSFEENSLELPQHRDYNPSVVRSALDDLRAIRACLDANADIAGISPRQPPFGAPADIPPIDPYFADPYEVDDCEDDYADVYDEDGAFDEDGDEDRVAFIVNDKNEIVYIIDGNDVDEVFYEDEVFYDEDDEDYYEDDESYCIEEEPPYVCRCGCGKRYYEDELSKISPLEACLLIYAPSSTPAPASESTPPPDAPYLAPAPFSSSAKDSNVDDDVRAYWTRTHNGVHLPESTPCEDVNTVLLKRSRGDALRNAGRGHREDIRTFVTYR